jgi:hypothetical protein
MTGSSATLTGLYAFSGFTSDLDLILRGWLNRFETPPATQPWACLPGGNLIVPFSAILLCLSCIPH